MFDCNALALVTRGVIGYGQKWLLSLNVHSACASNGIFHEFMCHRGCDRVYLWCFSFEIKNTSLDSSSVADTANVCTVYNCVSAHLNYVILIQFGCLRIAFGDKRRSLWTKTRMRGRKGASAVIRNASMSNRRILEFLQIQTIKYVFEMSISIHRSVIAPISHKMPSNGNFLFRSSSLLHLIVHWYSTQKLCTAIKCVWLLWHRTHAQLTWHWSEYHWDCVTHLCPIDYVKFTADAVPCWLEWTSLFSSSPELNATSFNRNI